MAFGRCFHKAVQTIKSPRISLMAVNFVMPNLTDVHGNAYELSLTCHGPRSLTG